MVSGRKLFLVLAGAGMVLGSFQAVSAHEVTAKSHVLIKATDKGFKGAVTSDEVSCIDGRKVILFKKNVTKKIDSTRTDDLGAWKMRVPHASGKYYVTVGRSIDEYEDEYHHLHECKAAESDMVRA